MNATTQTKPGDRANNLLVALLCGLPVLSLLLCFIGWLAFGIDIPFMDDWRPYITNEAGSLAPHVLFRPTNDTLSPVGLALDALALRWLGGNAIAYQALSMLSILVPLLWLQWRLLTHALQSRILAACAFSLTLLMLQPRSYWGEQNLAFHQAIPVVCLLASIHIIFVSKLKGLQSGSLLVFLGLVSGLTYISGAFCYLASGIAILVCSVLYAGQDRAKVRSGGLMMSLVGLTTSIPQFWVLAFFQKGTHRADAPMAYPYELDFWLYLLGKISRSLLLPTSSPAVSLVLAIAASAAFLILLGMAFRKLGFRKSVSATEADDRLRTTFSIAFSLAVAVGLYLLMVAAGRTNLRDPGFVDALQIFVFGHLRFHFFWVTLLWPWLVALVFVVFPRIGRGRWAALPVLCAVACWIAGGQALAHFDAFKDQTAFRSEGVACLIEASDTMKPMLCESIEMRDLRPAIRTAEKAGASFTRFIHAGATVPTPSNPAIRGIITLAPGTFMDGNFLAARSGSISSIALPIGNFSGSSDGSLNVFVCDTTRCASGKSELSASSDNNYFSIRFDHPIVVSEGDNVPFRVQTQEATRPVALWTSGPVEKSAKILRIHSREGKDTLAIGQTIQLEAQYDP